MNLEELYSKHRVLSDGLQRRYVIRTNERRYDLDFVTPIELVVLVPRKWEEKTYNCEIIHPTVVNKRFEKRAWVQLLKDLVTYLQSKAPKAKEELMKYRTDWSKAPIFSDKKSIDNMIKIDEGLFFSVNYTATHSSWIIGDILEFYGIYVGYLIVHRSPAAEPQEIKDEIVRVRRNEFKEFLMSKKGKTEEKADRIIKNIDTLNKILIKMGTSYNDFFLFDDTLALSNYKAKLIKDSYKYVNWTDSQFETAKRYLDYLTDYYTSLVKESKKNRNKLVFIIPTL